MHRRVAQLINFKATIMSLTVRYPSIDHLQAAALGMAHHNFSMLRLLSVPMSLYCRNNEKNYRRRLSRVSTIIATSLTMVSKTKIEILTSDIRVLRPWGYESRLHLESSLAECDIDYLLKNQNAKIHRMWSPGQNGYRLTASSHGQS